mgnify:CR=1 FL=1
MTTMREAQEAYDNRAEPEVDDDFEARVAAVEAQRAFFLAETELRAAIIGGGAPAEPPSTSLQPAASPGGGH